MKKIVFFIFLVSLVNLFAKSNNDIKAKEIEKQIKREQLYAKEQKFYQGKDYNLTDKQIDKHILQGVKKIEPEYDLDITDLYSD